eukprot:evm.model.scf_26.23 EVM.evm.TU.scf_26.23   scf_26:199266-200737(-)
MQELSSRPTLDSVIGLCESCSTVRLQQEANRLQGAQDEKWERHQTKLEALEKRSAEQEAAFVTFRASVGKESVVSLQGGLARLREELEDVARLLNRKIQALGHRFNAASIVEIKTELEQKLQSKAESNTVMNAVERLDGLYNDVKDELARKVDLRTFFAFANAHIDGLAPALTAAMAQETSDE